MSLSSCDGATSCDILTNCSMIFPPAQSILVQMINLLPTILSIVAHNPCTISKT
jgi:hypothetical protein